MALTHALKWSFLAELASKVIQPIVVVMLARLLAPEDFGVMTAAAMVIAFSQIFWEAGMAKALIQRQSDIEVAANAAFWVNIGLGVVVATFVYALAVPVANYAFHDGRVAAVLQVMTIQVMLGALSSIHTALLQKEMGFQKLFWVRFATVSLPGLASIPLAWGGLGYWALVAGAIAGQAAQLGLLWRMSPWRPRWSLNIIVAGEMGRFGAWVVVSGLLAWFYAWADSLIVGMHLGSHELGLYRTGNQVAIMIFALVFGPIVPVLYSHLARIGGEPERLAAEFERIVRILALIGVPVAFTVFAIADPACRALFGEQWRGIGFVVGVLALCHGIAWTVGMNGEAYRALGRPGYETFALGLPLIVYLGIYVVAIGQGFEVFVWSRVAAMAFGFGFQLFLLYRLMHIRLGGICRTLAKAGLVSLVCTALTGHYLEPILSGDAVKATILGITNLSAYLFAMYFLERSGLVVDLRRLIFSRATGR